MFSFNMLEQNTATVSRFQFINNLNMLFSSLSDGFSLVSFHIICIGIHFSVLVAKKYPRLTDIL